MPSSAALRLFVFLGSFLGIAAIVPISPARAQLADDYLTAGYRSILLTRMPGPFTGCTKDQTYVFADGSTFACRDNRQAFLIDPRVQLLESASGLIDVVLIGGVAYEGTFVQMRGGVAGHTVLTVVDALDVTSHPIRDAAVGPVPSIDPIQGIAGIRSITDLRNQDVQNYPPPKKSLNAR